MPAPPACYACAAASGAADSYAHASWLACNFRCSIIWKFMIYYVLMQVKAQNAPDLPVEAVLINHQNSTAPRPSVLIPHGGPHSCYPTSYYSGYSFLVTLGFNLVLVIFRGSTGFGEDSVQSLPGNIGTNDVLDCMACLQAAVDTGNKHANRLYILVNRLVLHKHCARLHGLLAGC